MRFTLQKTQGQERTHVRGNTTLSSYPVRLALTVSFSTSLIAGLENVLLSLKRMRSYEVGRSEVMLQR